MIGRKVLIKIFYHYIYFLFFFIAIIRLFLFLFLFLLFLLLTHCGAMHPDAPLKKKTSESAMRPDALENI